MSRKVRRKLKLLSEPPQVCELKSKIIYKDGMKTKVYVCAQMTCEEIIARSQRYLDIVAPGTETGYAIDLDRERYFVSESGIVVIPGAQSKSAWLLSTLERRASV